MFRAGFCQELTKELGDAKKHTSFACQMLATIARAVS
jgi:HD-like signal output (HDOD) protein